MTSWTTITVRRSDMERFRRMASRLRVPNHKLFGAVVLRFSGLTREQQEQDLGFAEPASPSTGDAVQCDQRTIPNQAKTPQPRVARRKAG